MIAKPEWFRRRRYSGWGLTPITKEGWLYVMAMAGIFIFIRIFPVVLQVKIILSTLWIVFFLVDILQTMASIKLDEREQKIDAISERNAAWTMVTFLALVIIYVSTFGKDMKGIDLMPILIFPIFAGVFAKGLSNFILEKRGI